MKFKRLTLRVSGLTKILVKIPNHRGSKSCFFTNFLSASPAIAANEADSIKSISKVYMFGNALIVLIALGVLIINFIIEYQMKTQAEDPRELLAQIVVVSIIASCSTLGGILLISTSGNPFWLLL
ncbi:MAG TPA: hypothetical protein V6D09_26155 [Leptolyngbyaceae cyanobacterium]